MYTLSFWVQLVSFCGASVGFLWIASSRFLGKAVEKGVEMGVQTIFLKKQTEIVENVKVEFGKELETFKTDLQEGLAQKIESLKATLNRENIAFQITHAELVKFRFNHLIELYAKAYEIKVLVKGGLGNLSERSVLSTSSKGYITKLNEDYIQKAFMSSLYLNEDANVTIQKMANMLPSIVESFIEYDRLQRMYNSVEIGDLINYVEDENGEPLQRLWELKDVNDLSTSVQNNKRAYTEQLQLFEQTFKEIERAIKNALQNP